MNRQSGFKHQVRPRLNRVSIKTLATNKINLVDSYLVITSFVRNYAIVELRIT